MKQIIFSVTNDLSHDRRMHRICGSLANAGYDVVLAGRKLKNSLPLDEKNFGQHRLSCFFNKGKFFYIEYNIRLFFYLLFSQADVYSAVDLDTILPCLFAAKIKNKKVAYDAHEYFTEVPEVIRRKTVKKIWERVALFTIPKMDACYTVSLSIANEFAKLYNKEFGVVRNVPVLMKYNSARKEGKYILYQGALNEGRGLEVLIEAMQDVPLPLIIAGEGDISQKLRDLVKQNHLQEKVIFKGMLRPEELLPITQNAWLGYNLLQGEGKSYYYSLSNKFFDYMHAGVPCLCNNFPEYATINKTHQLSVIINLDKAEIINAVTSLLSDESYYNKLSENCKIAAEKFNWQEEEKVLIEIYNGLW